MNELQKIIRENRRRKRANSAEFNPVTGQGSPGKRFLLEVEGFGRQWLPVSMKDADPVRRLLNAEGPFPPERETARIMEDIEALRLQHDFPYWASRYAYIKNKRGGDDMLFRLNRPQRRLVEALEAMRLARKPIRLILLKARQWGGSTCVQLYMAWLQLVHDKGLNSLIIAHQGVGSDEIKDMFDRMMEHYPASLLGLGEKEKKMEGVGRTRSMFRIPPRNCKIKVGTAERPDSCRGGDYSLVHCSEVGIWKKTLGKTPEDIVRSACSGVLLQPMTMIVYESTANGTGNFFHREYEAAKRGESQFTPLFIAWYEIDQYSFPLSAKEEKEIASRLLEGRDSESAGSDRRQPGKYLWWLWEKGATLEAHGM